MEYDFEEIKNIPKKVRFIARKWIKSGYNIKSLAKKYNISTSMVYLVINGQNPSQMRIVDAFLEMIEKEL